MLLLLLSLSPCVLAVKFDEWVGVTTLADTAAAAAAAGAASSCGRGGVATADIVVLFLVELVVAISKKFDVGASSSSHNAAEFDAGGKPSSRNI